jgi:hypothetical protein
MAGAEDRLQLGQEVLVRLQCRGKVTAFAGPGCEFGAGGEGVGVARAQGGFLIGQEDLVQARCLSGVPAPAGPARDVVAGG